MNMKQGNSIRARRRIFSLLMAVLMVIATVLPSAAVYSAEEADGSESVVSVPEEGSAPAEENEADEPEADGGASEESSAPAEEAETPAAPETGGEAAPETQAAETNPAEGSEETAGPEGEDAAPQDGSGDPESEEPAETESSKTTLKIGENEFVVTLDGDYSDQAAALCVPENAEAQKEALEEAMGAFAENFRIVELRDANNNPVTLGKDMAAYEEEIPVTVSGSWLSEYISPVFALMNADGTAQIVEAQQDVLDDGTSCRRFRADALSSLMLCEKGEMKPDAMEESEEDASEMLSAQDDGTSSMDVKVNIKWTGDEPEDLSSRPIVVYLTMERSTDGTNWEPYTQTIPFAITSFSTPPWTATFTLPAQDGDGNPYTYRATESDDGLGRYLLPEQNPVTTEAGADSEIEFTNTYNDEWDYHLRLFWDVSTDEGKVLQDVHTTDRSTQEAVYHVAVSTQKPYEACDDPLNPTKGITVRIPRALCTDRNGDPVYPSAVSVGTGDDFDPYYYFKYTIDPDTDELVFYNWSDLPGSYNIDIKVQYKLDPMQIPDCTLGELQAHGEGHYPFQPDTDDGKQDSDPIYYRLDTGAAFTKFTKDSGYPLRAVPPAMSADDFDFANYHYMVYILRCEVNGNQPLVPLQFTDRPTDPNGKYADEGGKVIAILQPDETDSVSGSGADEVHTYRRPAAALSTPSGTPVAFTAGADGSASWTEDLDLLRKSDNGNYANQGEQCYYLIVRYNATNEQGYVITDYIYHNEDAEGALEVKDPQHDGVDVRGVNDLYDTDNKKNAATGHWEPEDIPPVGPGPYYAKKALGENAYPAYIAGSSSSISSARRPSSTLTGIG